jgi:hypothetical protein
MTINLKDYAGKLVVATLRNGLMLVSNVIFIEGLDYDTYTIDGKYYSDYGKIFGYDVASPYDIVDIKLADEEPEPVINRVEVITHDEGRVYVNWEKDNKITTSLQDEGRTLKIFVNKNTEEPVTAKCCYNDCGWCYAPSHLNNNAVNGACKNPNECPTLNDKEFMPTKLEFTIEPEVIDDLWHTAANYKKFANDIAKMMSSSTKVKVSNYWATALSNFIDELGGDSPALWGWGGITPTPEKVVEYLRDYIKYLEQSAADRELEACVELIVKRSGTNSYTDNEISTWMRNTRRPQPTLKSQALKDFQTVRKHSDLLPEILDTIENALKSIPE